MAIAPANNAAVAPIPKERWAQKVGDMAMLRMMLNKSMEAIATALPAHLKPERMLRIVLSAASRNPKLLDCTGSSLVGAVVQSSVLGLECDSALGQAYLVPFFNGKTKQTECQLIPGYKGLVKLARNSGELLTIQDRCVFRGDEFRYAFGLDPVLEHIPRYTTTEITHAWASALLNNGGRQFEVMSIAEIEKIRARSRAKDSGPWQTDYEMMCRKTVIKRLCRLLPQSVELSRALVLDDRSEAGKWQGTGSIEVLPETIAELPPPDDATDAEPAAPAAKGEAPARDLTETELEAQRWADSNGVAIETVHAISVQKYGKPLASLSSNQFEAIVRELGGKL